MLIAKGIECGDWVGSLVSALIGGLIAIFIARKQNEQQKESMKNQNEFNLFNDYAKYSQNSIKGYVKDLVLKVDMSASKLKTKEDKENYLNDLIPSLENLVHTLDETVTVYNEMIKHKGDKAIKEALNKMINICHVTLKRADRIEESIRKGSTQSFNLQPFKDDAYELKRLSVKFNNAITEHLVKRLKDTYK